MWTKCYENKTRKWSNKLCLKALRKRSPSRLPGGTHRGGYSHVRDEDGGGKIRTKARGVQCSRILTHLAKGERVFSGPKGRVSLIQINPICILVTVRIKLLESESAMPRGRESARNSHVGSRRSPSGSRWPLCRAPWCCRLSIPQESLGPHTQDMTHGFTSLKKKMFQKRSSSSPNRGKKSSPSQKREREILN